MYIKLQACLVYVKLKLIGKILTLLQQTWNSAVPLSSHKLRERRSLSSFSFPFLVYVRHFLNHTIAFLAPSLVQRPRQPPTLPDGSAGIQIKSFLSSCCKVALSLPGSACLGWAGSHFSDSDSAPHFKTSAPTPKNFETSTLTHVNTPKPSKQPILKRYCLFYLMRQNICRGYFAFDRTQTVEMVTWLAQYRETQHIEV